MNGLLLRQFRSCMTATRQLKLGRVATTATLQTIRNISFRRKKFESAAIDVQPIKSEYEIELEKVKEKENYHHFKFGFDDIDPYHDKLIAHMIMFLGFSMACIFTPIMVFVYGPDHRSRMVEWRKYEAAKILEEREARGECPLDQDFVPRELIESMVPPPGDWEEQWLDNQPSVRTKHRRHYYIEVEQS